MTEHEYFEHNITANTLVAQCRGLTALQKFDYLRPLLGKWLKIRGMIFAVTDNRPIAGFGVTITVPDPNSAIDVFCAFYVDHERLALATPGDVVEVEGSLSDVNDSGIKLENCLLLNTIDGSRVSDEVTRDQYLRSFINSLGREDNLHATLVTEIGGLRLKEATSAMKNPEVSVAVIADLKNFHLKIDTLAMTNFEKSSAQ